MSLCGIEMDVCVYRDRRYVDGVTFVCMCVEGQTY